MDHQQELASKYDGMVIVIKDGGILGVYKTQLEAIVATRKKHALGTFLVQQVSKDASGYTHTFHSRVAFQ